jgi:hypothetical protein
MIRQRDVEATRGGHTMDETQAFVRGMELAGDLLEKVPCREPELLRRAAEHVSGLLEGPLVSGYVAALRIRAAELEDEQDAQNPTLGILRPAGRSRAENGSPLLSAPAITLRAV